MTHTWDLNLYYHECPQCGFILESRKDYEYASGKYHKELDCLRCKHHFILEKKSKTTGPIFGKHPKPEFDWS